MADIQHAALELREMDDLAQMDSPVHRLHPLSKLLVTVVYLLTVVSFPKYALSALFPMILYPVLLFALSGISAGTCFYKLRLLLPLLLFVGVFNPILDRAPLFRLGTLAVSGGTVSFLSFLLKGLCCLTASFLLAATTTLDALCAALRQLRLPRFFVTLLLLTFRYVSVMLDELAAMNTAYRLRAPGQNGIRFSAWGSFLGQLLLRSMDRAEELYASMQLRGFCGEFPYAGPAAMRFADVLYAVAATAVILLFRFVNVSRLLGALWL